MSISDAEDVFVDGGEMGALMRSLNWSQTPLGPVNEWTQSLRTVVRGVLNARSPSFLCWGPRLITLYNDSYRSLLGATQHAGALGELEPEARSAIWDTLEPLVKQVMATGEAAWSGNLRLLTQRDGYLEEAYFTFSCTPIWEATGEVGGVVGACTETTSSVLSDRRLRTLRSLASSTTHTKTLAEAYLITAHTLSTNPHDIPFALLYSVEPEERQAHLIATTPNISSAIPDILQQVDLTQKNDLWRLAEVEQTAAPVLISDLTQQIGSLPGETWPDAPAAALVMPLGKAGQRHPLAGFLVLAISPQREFDDDYRGFFDLVASSVATAIANASADTVAPTHPEAGHNQQISDSCCAPVPHLEKVPVDAAGEATATLSHTQRREAQLRLAIQVARLGTWRYDPSHGLVELDERMGEIWGLPAERRVISLAEAIARIHPADRTQVTQAVEAALEPTSSGRYEIEYRIIWDDGTERWISANGQATFVGEAEQRHPVEFLGTALDMTERKRSELALQESEARFRHLADTAPTMIWMSGQDKLCNYFNPSWLNFTGRTLEQEMGNGWVEGVHADDLQRCLDTYSSAFAARRPFEMDYRLQRFDGHYRWILDVGMPRFAPSGEFLGYIGSCFDIHERKQAEKLLLESEERFRNMADNAPVMIWVTDPTGYCTYLSQSWYAFSGQTEDVALGFGWLAAVHPDDRENARAVFVTANDRHEAFQIEYRLRRQDGEYRWAIDTASPWFGIDGEFKGYIGSVIDISDRKQIEEDLRQREAELSLLTNAVPALISFVDADQRYRFNNRGYEEWFGQSGIALAGKHLREVLGEAAYQEIRPYVEQVLAGHPVSFERQLAYQDGGARYVNATYVPHFNEAGNVEGFVALISDISDRKRTEAVLQQREQRLDLATRAAKLGVFEWHAQTDQVIWENPQMYEIFGYPPTAGTLNRRQFLNEVIHPDDRAGFEMKLLESIKDKSFHLVCRIRRQTDGQWRWVEFSGQFELMSDGNPLRLVGVASDISDRQQAEETLRQSEERYRYLAESIPQLVWTADATGTMMDVNQRWSTFTGLSLAQAKTEGWQAIVHPDDASNLGQCWLKAQQAGTYYQAEGRMRRADGIYRWHLHQAVPLKDDQGQVIKWFGTATDIEDQKQLEQRRLQLLEQEQAAREQAEAANRIKDEFLAVVSHELRSPLNPILGWSKLLRSRQLDDQKTQRALEVIERNAQIQAQLINDLLDVSRILRGKLSLKITPVNLASIIQSALETVCLAAEAKSIQIHTMLAPNVGNVAGDPDRLQQIIWNLLSNAIKFTAQGGQVDVRLEHYESSDWENSFQGTVPPGLRSYAQVTITDTGRGIDPNFLPYVFDRFRQEDAATTRQFGGLGLGLALVRYLVELHGGTVHADSPGEGQGSTFTVRLPVMPHAATTVAPAKPVNAPLSLQGIHILVVDDDDSTRELVVFLLELHGATVTAANSASEAIALVPQHKPDVLLSDIGMPNVDGYMLMRQVRALPPDQGGQIPAIALTAYASEINHQQALAAGFHRHISKPVEPDLLVEAIADLIKH